MPRPDALGTAFRRAAQDAHVFGVAMFLGLGGLAFLYGAYGLTSLLRDTHEAKRGRWI